MSGNRLPVALAGFALVLTLLAAFALPLEATPLAAGIEAAVSAAE
jgi:hypothetical protein